MYYHYNAANTKCFVEMLERLFAVFEEMREDMKIMKRMQTTIYNTIKNQGPATAEPDLSEVILPLCSKKKTSLILKIGSKTIKKSLMPR